MKFGSYSIARCICYHLLLLLQILLRQLRDLTVKLLIALLHLLLKDFQIAIRRLQILLCFCFSRLEDINLDASVLVLIFKILKFAAESFCLFFNLFQLFLELLMLFFDDLLEVVMSLACSVDPFLDLFFMFLKFLLRPLSEIGRALD